MLLVNVNTKQFIPSAGSNFIQPVESRDQIIYGTRVEVRFQLYNPDGTVFALNESDVFCCAGDINFIHTDDLMFYSGHEMCRIIDAAQGIVGVTIDATSDSFAAKATLQNTRMYVQLKRHVAGDTLGDTVLQDIVYAQPAVMTTEGAPASSDPEYMTAAATLALLRTAPDYQFSVDGETDWHDQQDIAADRFYRERRNGGEWGPAIELIEGKTGQTGAAAGFGTPTIAVETLPAGSDATATITASGDDTAKVFSFSLGIPKGADGDGAGDMTKAVYDTNDDGIVDHAATADAVGATTAAQVADAVSKAHAHANKATLDKLAETDGKLAFDGAEIGGASNWNDITGKPETFPPSAHNHAITDVTGLEDALQNAGSVKSVNGQLPDESGNVTVETGSTVDESRLLPEDPANGDIPCFDATATIGGGNDANTRLLLQPSTSDHGIVDQAAGNAAPVTLENHNVTVDEEGNMVFDGSNAYLKIPANTLPSDFFNGTDEWTLDIVYNVASKGMQCLFGCSSSLRMDFLLDSDGSLQIGGGPNLGTGWPFNEDVHLTFEIYKDGTVWKYTIFRNGSVVTTGTWVNADWRSVAQYVGWEGKSDSRKINGKIKALRLTSGALHKGAAFQSDYPWTKPQTVGEWGKFNKSALVKSVNGVTPDADGNINLTEISGYDFLGIGYNKVPKQKPKGLVLPNEFKRLKFGFSNNIPLASISAENCFPFIMANATGSDEYMAVCPADPAQPNWFTFRTDGFMIKLIKLNLRIDKGSVDVAFDYELYGSLDAAAVYDGISEGWDLLHSGKAYIIAQSDNTKKLVIEIPEASQKYYRSYTFKMSSVSGPGIIEWSPQYMLHGWGSASPVESVNGQTPDGYGAVTLPTATASAAGLMAAADKAKLNNNFTTMTTGSIDFNQLTDVGVYFVSGSAEHTNYPGTTAKIGGILTVQGIGAYRAQSFAVFGSLNQSVTWTRWATSNGSSWTFQGWRKHLIDLDITEPKTGPGYFKLPGGTIMQWGAATITMNGLYQVTFPLAFPNAIFIGNATAVSGTGDASGVVISINGPQTNRMTLITKNHPGNDQDINVHWLAIGY